MYFQNGKIYSYVSIDHDVKLLRFFFLNWLNIKIPLHAQHCLPVNRVLK